MGRLASFLPYFNETFTTVKVLDGKFYYWGLKSLKAHGQSKGMSVYAIHYDFAKTKIDSLFLYQKNIATDNTSYFRSPLIKNGKIHFYSMDSKWVVEKNLTNKKKLND